VKPAHRAIINTTSESGLSATSGSELRGAKLDLGLTLAVQGDLDYGVTVKRWHRARTRLTTTTFESPTAPASSRQSRRFDAWTVHIARS